MESASVAVGGDHHAEEHHGPPEAHQSSRIDRQTLGILLFIITEAMLFGAFFASYFFLRVVANEGPWPPPEFELLTTGPPKGTVTREPFGRTRLTTTVSVPG